MEAIIYYGNGMCEVKCSNVIAVSLKVSNPIEIENLFPDSYFVKAKNANITIMNIKRDNKFLTQLFKYKGNLHIISAKVTVLGSVQIIDARLKKVMEYAELLTTEPDEMTLVAEDYKNARQYTAPVQQMKVINPIVTNLTNLGNFYYKDGRKYTGPVHMDTEAGEIFSEGVPNEESQALYFKKTIDGITLDKLHVATVANAIKINSSLRRRRQAGRYNRTRNKINRLREQNS